MVYSGTVKNGVVVFEAGSPPEGTSVRVEVAGEDVRDRATSNDGVFQRLSRYAGAVENLPADFAKNHDHYIHGADKK